MIHLKYITSSYCKIPDFLHSIVHRDNHAFPLVILNLLSLSYCPVLLYCPTASILLSHCHTVCLTILLATVSLSNYHNILSL